MVYKQGKKMWYNFVVLITDREQIREVIQSKQSECATREPQKFDENKKDHNWINFGKEAIALKLDDKILSVLTFTEENNNNLRLRLIHTVKNYQRHGFGRLLVEHAFKIAYKRNLKTLSVCIDNSEGEHIENLMLGFNFKHVQNGFVKLIN